jgi:hypothetical protein
MLVWQRHGLSPDFFLFLQTWRVAVLRIGMIYFRKHCIGPLLAVCSKSVIFRMDIVPGNQVLVALEKAPQIWAVNDFRKSAV